MSSFIHANDFGIRFRFVLSLYVVHPFGISGWFRFACIDKAKARVSSSYFFANLFWDLIHVLGLALEAVFASRSRRALGDLDLVFTCDLGVIELPSSCVS